MELKINWKIVTDGKEKVENKEKNLYSLTESGYKIFPIDTSIEVYKKEKTSPIGKGIVKEVIMKNNETIVIYELVSLNTVN